MMFHENIAAALAAMKIKPESMYPLGIASRLLGYGGSITNKAFCKNAEIKPITFPGVDLVLYSHDNLNMAIEARFKAKSPTGARRLTGKGSRGSLAAERTRIDDLNRRVEKLEGAIYKMLALPGVGIAPIPGIVAASDVPQVASDDFAMVLPTGARVASPTAFNGR